MTHKKRAPEGARLIFQFNWLAPLRGTSASEGLEGVLHADGQAIHVFAVGITARILAIIAMARYAAPSSGVRYSILCPAWRMARPTEDT